MVGVASSIFVTPSTNISTPHIFFLLVIKNICKHLTPQHLTPQHLTPQHLTPQHLTPQHLTPQHLTPQHLTPQHLIPQGDRQCISIIILNYFDRLLQTVPLEDKVF